MDLFCRIIITLLTVSICNAEIITRHIELQENYFVDIDNNTVDSIFSPFLRKDEKNDSIVKLQCLNSNFDLAYLHLGFWDNFECGCGGGIYGVTSGRPLYTIKTQSETIFNSPLDTADTIISNNENGYNSQHCQVWNAIQPNLFSGICGVCTLSTLPTRLSWFLGKTQKNHYYLFRYDTTKISNAASARPVLRVKIICILQTDGSSDFSKAFESATIKTLAKQNQLRSQKQSAIRKVLTSEIATQTGTLYNIQGKRIGDVMTGKSSGNAIRLYILAK